MKILILGSGGREFSIALAIKNEDKTSEFFFAPGNGGTKMLGENVEAVGVSELVSFAKSNKIELCIVGSEDFLAKGVVDAFENAGIAIFGPTKRAAMLESSKAFMKEFLQRHKIRTAKFLNTDDFVASRDFINANAAPIVVKADGLCAGKGVIIANTKEEALNAAKSMLDGTAFGEAGRKIIIEEYLDGFELSIFALCDGKDFVILPAAQDHKKLHDNDKGPNTGGMGAYAPSPLANTALLDRVKSEIIAPTLAGMRAENAEFKGVLFAGLMIKDGVPYVLEFNVRFGDPECEVLMPLIKNPLELIKACVNGTLNKTQMKLQQGFAVGVVCASENYPYKASLKAEITLGKILSNTHISYAGVSKDGEKLYATGGRVLVCVGVAHSLRDARDKAYELCDNIAFRGKQNRTDIAWQGLK